MQPLGGQVANAGMEVVPEQGRGGEDEIGEAAGVGILLFYLPSRLVHQQAVEDIRCLAHRGGNDLSGEWRILVRAVGVGLYEAVRQTRLV